MPKSWINLQIVKKLRENDTGDPEEWRQNCQIVKNAKSWINLQILYENWSAGFGAMAANIWNLVLYWNVFALPKSDGCHLWGKKICQTVDFFSFLFSQKEKP